MGNIDRISTIGEFGCDSETGVLLLTRVGEAEMVDAGAGGGGGGEDRTEAATLTGAS